MALQIKSEVCPNSEYCNIHVKVEISQTNYQSFYRPLRSSSNSYLEEVGEKGAELVRRAIGIPGVTEVMISPYELSLRKALLFDWKKIIPPAEKALKEIFGREKEREEAKYLSLSQIPIGVIFSEPWKRLGWLIRKVWYRIPNLAE